MRSLLFIITAFLLVSCMNQPPPTQSADILPPTSIPTTTSVENQRVEVTPIVTATNIVEPTETPIEVIPPDFSAVLLFEATHLMDPSFFQIVLQNWPLDVTESVQVFVDNVEYSCEVLFPDQFPDRNYCWGPAPKRGIQVNIQVLMEEDPTPVLEIPFIVPSPGS